MAASSVGSVPVVEGLFQQLTPAVLLGSRCRQCGTHYFPKVLSCSNPACRDGQVLHVPLSGRGRLYSFTVQRYRPPPPFNMESWAPYALGILELPEGLRIMGMISGVPFDELAIGMELDVISEALRHEQGHGVLTYKFSRAAQSVPHAARSAP